MDDLEVIKKRVREVSSNKIKEGYKPSGLYLYRDKLGQIIYVRYRLDHPEKGKYIRPLSRNEAGEWRLPKEPKLEDGKMLYGLYELAQNSDKPVFVVEGEKCVDALSKCGVLAITSGGATSVKDANWVPLQGREVIIWRDNDDAGLSFESTLIEALAGIAKTIRCIDVDSLDLPRKGDCYDWILIFKTANNKPPDDVDILAILEKETANHQATSDLNNACAPYPYADKKTQQITPEPLPDMPEVKAFEFSYLPQVLCAYVKDISHRMQCPPDYAASATLVMLSALIGRKVAIRPKRLDNWTVIPNLWGAVVGNSGVKKSPTLSESLKPIKKLALEASEQHQKALAKYNEASEINKMKAKANRKAAQAKIDEDINADVTGLLKQDEQEEPKLKRYVANNTTVEALAELLIDNTNGLLVEADEIIGLLKKLDAAGQEPARAFYLTGADGDKGESIDRIGRGNLHVPAVCLSIIGGIQPGVLSQYVREAVAGGAGSDGLLQRFGLMVYPDVPKTVEYVDAYPDEEAKASMCDLVEWLDNLNPLVQLGAESDEFSDVPYLHFDDDAQKLFADWQVKHDTRLRSGEDHPAIVSHLSKYPNMITSLALIFHLTEQKAGAVSYQALQRAISYSNYLESHARRIYGIATHPEIDAAKSLLRKMQKQKLDSVFTARDVYRKGWAGLETAEKAKAAIDILIDYGWLKPIEEITENGVKKSYILLNQTDKTDSLNENNLENLTDITDKAHKDHTTHSENELTSLTNPTNGGGVSDVSLKQEAFHEKNESPEGAQYAQEKSMSTFNENEHLQTAKVEQSEPVIIDNALRF